MTPPRSISVAQTRPVGGDVDTHLDEPLPVLPCLGGRGPPGRRCQAEGIRDICPAYRYLPVIQETRQATRSKAEQEDGRECDERGPGLQRQYLQRLSWGPRQPLDREERDDG
jgi:hypothetical protein